MVIHNKKTINDHNKSTSTIGIPSIFFKNKSILSFSQFSGFPKVNDFQYSGHAIKSPKRSIYGERLCSRIRRIDVPSSSYLEEQKIQASKIIESKKRKFENEEIDNPNKKVCLKVPYINKEILDSEKKKDLFSQSSMLNKNYMKSQSHRCSGTSAYYHTRVIDKEYTLRDESFLLNPFMFENTENCVKMLVDNEQDLSFQENYMLRSEENDSKTITSSDNCKIINLQINKPRNIISNQYKTKSITQLLLEIDNHRLLGNKSNKRMISKNIEQRSENIKNMLSDSLPNSQFTGCKDKNIFYPVVQVNSSSSLISSDTLSVSVKANISNNFASNGHNEIYENSDILKGEKRKLDHMKPDLSINSVTNNEMISTQNLINENQIESIKDEKEINSQNLKTDSAKLSEKESIFSSKLEKKNSESKFEKNSMKFSFDTKLSGTLNPTKFSTVESNALNSFGTTTEAPKDQTDSNTNIQINEKSQSRVFDQCLEKSDKFIFGQKNIGNKNETRSLSNSQDNYSNTKSSLCQDNLDYKSSLMNVSTNSSVFTTGLKNIESDNLDNQTIISNSQTQKITNQNVIDLTSNNLLSSKSHDQISNGNILFGQCNNFIQKSFDQGFIKTTVINQSFDPLKSYIQSSTEITSSQNISTTSKTSNETEAKEAVFGKFDFNLKSGNQIASGNKISTQSIATSKVFDGSNGKNTIFGLYTPVTSIGSVSFDEVTSKAIPFCHLSTRTLTNNQSISLTNQTSDMFGKSVSENISFGKLPTEATGFGQSSSGTTMLGGQLTSLSDQSTTGKALINQSTSGPLFGQSTLGTPFGQFSSVTTFGQASSGAVFCQSTTGISAFGQSTERTEFGQTLPGITLSQPLSRTVFGQPSSGTIFGQVSSGTTLSQSLPGIAFGQSSSGTAFGQGSSGTAFGQISSGTTLGQSLPGIAFGQGSSTTTFGQVSSGTTHGQSLPGIAFGQASSTTTFGQVSSGTVFGQASLGTTFGQVSSGTAFDQVSAGTSLFVTQSTPGAALFGQASDTALFGQSSSKTVFGQSAAGNMSFGQSTTLFNQSNAISKAFDQNSNVGLFCQPNNDNALFGQSNGIISNAFEQNYSGNSLFSQSSIIISRSNEMQTIPKNLMSQSSSKTNLFGNFNFQNANNHTESNASQALGQQSIQNVSFMSNSNVPKEFSFGQSQNNSFQQPEANSFLFDQNSGKTKTTKPLVFGQSNFNDNSLFSQSLSNSGSFLKSNTSSNSINLFDQSNKSSNSFGQNSLVLTNSTFTSNANNMPFSSSKTNESNGFSFDKKSNFNLTTQSNSISSFGQTSLGQSGTNQVTNLFGNSQNSNGGLLNITNSATTNSQNIFKFGDATSTTFNFGQERSQTNNFFSSTNSKKTSRRRK